MTSFLTRWSICTFTEGVMVTAFVLRAVKILVFISSEMTKD